MIYILIAIGVGYTLSLFDYNWKAVLIVAFVSPWLLIVGLICAIALLNLLYDVFYDCIFDAWQVMTGNSTTALVQTEVVVETV